MRTGWQRDRDREYSRLYRLAHHEETLAARRERYARKKRQRDYARDYRLVNADAINERKRAWSAAHRDKVRSYWRAWREKHPNYRLFRKFYRLGITYTNKEISHA